MLKWAGMFERLCSIVYAAFTLKVFVKRTSTYPQINRIHNITYFIQMSVFLNFHNLFEKSKNMFGQSEKPKILMFCTRVGVCFMKHHFYIINTSNICLLYIHHYNIKYNYYSFNIQIPTLYTYVL